MSDKTKGQAALIKAITEIKRLKAKLKESEGFKKETIAVVGMACRFPGGSNSIDEFWDMLVEKRHGVKEIPPSRWDADEYYDPTGKKPGTSNVRHAGFLDDVLGFDADFFGVTEEQADSMDPQQRVMMELGWEAMENAGITRDMIEKVEGGAFVGHMTHDYVGLLYHKETRIGEHAATGNESSFLCGRLSAMFDMNGPSLSVDTACSSSVVASDLAVQNLRMGRCDIAMAGAVDFLLAPSALISTTEMLACATDQKHKSFDTAADGIIVGEGAGIIVLKRLSDAIANGDRIHALIHGTSVLQNGDGLLVSAPNPEAQMDMIRKALKESDLEPEQVQHVEAHGSATKIGDQVELETLGAVYGRKDKNNQLFLGCSKPNLGHMKAAGGIAGIIKVILSLKHHQFPGVLNFKNPLIPLEEHSFVIPTELTEWKSDKTRYAGVSAFGAGGTIAHMILEEAPEAEAHESAGAGKRIVPFSAHSPEALQAMLDSYGKFLASANDDSDYFYDLAYTASVRRNQQDYRTAFVADSVKDLKAQIDADKSNFEKNTPNVVFVFSQDSDARADWFVNLLEQEPVFKAKLEEIDEAFQKETNSSIIEQMKKGEGSASVIFGSMAGLASLWQSWGLKPNGIVAGHHESGAIEAAAAYSFGLASLGDAVAFLNKGGELKLKKSSKQIVSMATGDVITSVKAGSVAQKHTDILKKIQGHFPAEDGIQNLFLELRSGGENGGPLDVDKFKSGTGVSIHAKADDYRAEMYIALKELYSSGVQVSWDKVYTIRGTVIDLPLYAWQKKPYWVKEVKEAVISHAK